MCKDIFSGVFFWVKLKGALYGGIFVCSIGRKADTFKRHVLFKFIGTCRRELVFLWGQRRAPVWNVCRAFYFVTGIRGLIGVYWADVKICFRTALETYLGDAADLRAEVLILIKGSRGVSLLEARR